MIGVSDKIIALKHISTGEIFDVKREVVRNNFIYAYCYTAHSKQGCSVDGDIVIYDWHLWYVYKNWLFTSITRATDVNRVKFYRYAEGEEDKNKALVKQYFERKVLSYIQQNKKAGRDVNDGEFVDVFFSMSLMNTQCENCNEPLTVDFEDGNITSNISCQRVNCSIGHFKDNCIGLCKDCNCVFSNKISLKI